MGQKSIYTVKDYKTGKVIARGTAAELEAAGIVPKGRKTWGWAATENHRKKREYLITCEKVETKRTEPPKRMTNVYTCYNAAGDVIGKGTARELWEAGVFDYEGAAYYTYTEQGGCSKRKGVARMTCKKELLTLRSGVPTTPKEDAGEAKKAAIKKRERPLLKGIPDPTPLDYDVHDLITYNKAARKEGRKELTYGYWAAAGKPATPTTAASGGNREEVLGPRPAGYER